MNSAIQAAVESSIDSEILHVTPVGGGCINSSFRIELSNGQRAFVKYNDREMTHFFESEIDGLSRIHQSGAIRVPCVLGAGSVDGVPFLVLEWIEQGKRKHGFSNLFARQLADLHRESSEQFGFERDGLIGATVQPNPKGHDWVEFWAENRFGYQLRLAYENGFTDKDFQSRGEKLISKLGQLIKTNESPALIHGDLWSGNYFCDQDGSPVVFDPAVYFAHREAEFGMTTLFGGFEASFYEAYSEAWPMEDGYEQRIEIYRLYHLLNHLNLFGRSYYLSCFEIIKAYA